MDNGASSYRRFLNGDDEGIVEIIRDYKDGLMLFLNRYVCNIYIAEELTEETFVKIVTKRPIFTAKYSFKTWLYTIGRNVAMNYINKNKRLDKRPIDDFSKLQSFDDIEREILKKEQNFVLYKSLSELKRDYAYVLHLKFFENMSNEDISKVLKKSKRQVENLLYQAKLSLKIELKKEGFIYEEL